MRLIGRGNRRRILFRIQRQFRVQAGGRFGSQALHLPATKPCPASLQRCNPAQPSISLGLSACLSICRWSGRWSAAVPVIATAKSSLACPGKQERSRQWTTGVGAATPWARGRSRLLLRDRKGCSTVEAVAAALGQRLTVSLIRDRPSWLFSELVVQSAPSHRRRRGAWRR